MRPQSGTSILEINDSSADAWNDFVGECSVYHRYEWRTIIERVFGKRGVYLAAIDADGRWLGVLPLVHMRSLLFGDFLVSMPFVTYGGAIAHTADVFHLLMAEAARKAEALGSRHVEFRHEKSMPVELPVRTNKVSMILPLPESAEATWAGFKPKLRAQIRRPEKAGADCEIGGSALIDEFYSIFAVNMRDLGTPVYAKRFFESVIDVFPGARVAVVRIAGVPAAAGIVIGNGSRLEIPWASSLRSLNKLSPNMLLYWRLIEWAITQGYREFDFGRCTRDSGTYRFKKQWGATERPLFWYYWLRDGASLPELNPDNPAYARLVSLWQRLPVWLSRLAGPHIVKHLP